jgi:H+/gluconate symporter-like permease
MAKLALAATSLIFSVAVPVFSSVTPLAPLVVLTARSLKLSELGESVTVCAGAQIIDAKPNTTPIEVFLNEEFIPEPPN